MTIIRLPNFYSVIHIFKCFQYGGNYLVHHTPSEFLNPSLVMSSSSFHLISVNHWICILALLISLIITFANF
jgi:hypothetical protein